MAQQHKKAEDLDLNLLPIFMAIYEQKNLSVAAGNLKISQSGLSGALKRLRSAIGDPLFVRTGHGMEPTPRAHKIAASIGMVLTTISEEVLASDKFDPLSGHHEFHVAMTDVAEVPILSILANVFTRLAPNATVLSVPRRYRELERALERGEIDLAIGFFPDFRSSNIMARSLTSFSFRSFVRQDHPLAGAHITVEEFRNAGHIVVEPENRSVDLVTPFLLRKNINRRVVVRTPHFLCVPQILAGTDLIATLPVSKSGYLYFNEPLAELYTPLRMPVGEVKVFWHRTQHDEKRNRWLRQIIVREYLRTLTTP